MINLLKLLRQKNRVFQWTRIIEVHRRKRNRPNTKSRRRLQVQNEFHKQVMKKLEKNQSQ